MRAAGVLGVAALMAACGSETPQTAGDTKAANLTRSATLAAACSGCHVTGGTALADISGRSAEALASSLNAYRTDTGGTTVMHRLARGYSEADIDAIATYLAEEG